MENNNTIYTEHKYPCGEVQTSSDATVESTTQHLTSSQSYTLAEENPCTMCFCNNMTINKTTEEIQEAIARIQQSLFVDTKTLTSHKIKRISAGDDRTSSTYMGGVAIAVLVMAACAILLIDLWNAMTYCSVVR